MDDTTVDEWMSFFRDAGIPPNVSASYASSFCQNRIHLNMVLELNRDLLKELGVTLIGDAIAILRHAKSFHEQNVRQKILNSMSPEYRKPPDFCQKLSTTDVASIANNKRFDGVISNRDVLPVAHNLPKTVTCKNGNNQEVMDLRQHTQLTSKQNSRPVTASQSQVVNEAPNISVGTLQREELQVCEALIPAVGETGTTEEMNVPYIASKNQNNLCTSHSECSLMRGSVELSSTLPIRQASVPSSLSGGNYICRRKQGLKRSLQQNTLTTIMSASQQHAGRLPYRTPNTPTHCLSPNPRMENNTLQDCSDDAIQTQGTKRKRTSSYYGSHEQEQFHPNIHMESVGTRVAKRRVYESQNTIETVDSEELQGQESSQLGAGVLREDVKTEVTATENLTESHSSSEPRCQPNLQREQEESPVQLCKRVLSQERLQMSISPPDKYPQSQTMSESQLPSLKASSSLLRSSQSQLRSYPTLEVRHESQSSLQQPSMEPQSSHAESSEANGHKNLELQTRKVMMHCNPVRSSSTAKFILATGKNINKNFKLLQSRPRTSYMTLVPHSNVCYQHNEVQRNVRSFAVSRCSNKSILKENKNKKEKEELVQTVLESGNASCVLQNGSETEFIGAGGDLPDEELGSLPDLNSERPSIRWDTHQLSKPVVQTSNRCVYEDSSSHTFRNTGNDAENNLQHERVPGQIFSRLGVKVELVSEDNDVCNTTVENDALPSCRFGSSVKYKINKSKKYKNLPNKFAKIMAGKQLSQNKLLKRKIVFTAFQKDSTTSRQNIVPGQATQEVTSIDSGQTKLRGILKSQTNTSKQQEDMEPNEEDQSQKMTANLLLESVTRSGATDLDMVSDAVQLQENSLSNDCTKSEDGDYIYQDSHNFCSDNEPQEGLNRASTNGISKTVHFGPVCVKEFEKNALPISGKAETVFRRLGARRKEI